MREAVSGWVQWVSYLKFYCCLTSKCTTRQAAVRHAPLFDAVRGTGGSARLLAEFPMSCETMGHVA